MSVNCKDEVVAYVDGSYVDELKKYSYGCVLFYQDNKYGKFGEQLTIQYYKNNGTVLLQGRPLLLFSDARSYLCTLLDEEKAHMKI